MSRGVLLALRRKRESFEKAGLADKVAAIDERIMLYEIELGISNEPPVRKPEPQQEIVTAQIDPMDPKHGPEESEAEAAGVVLTPAAQAKADELGLTSDDYKGHTPSGTAGEFLVRDVQRIAEAKAHLEENEDGDNELP